MIIHVDMDAFFASVEIRDRPELEGQPVVVGGSPTGRGVVAAASYEARRYGIHSAMPAAAALRRCPDAVFLEPRMPRYAEVSRQIHDIFERYTPLVESLSLDEAFLDARGSERLFGPSIEIAGHIRREIAAELELVASVGVAPNKFLAKIASDLDKPDGFCVVEPDEVQAFLDPLPVGRLWGVGRVTQKEVTAMGIRTIGDLRTRPLTTLLERFGQSGAHLWHLAHGKDDRPVVPESEAKSLSRETTFEQDLDDADAIRGCLRSLTEDVAYRARRNRLQGRTVTIKARFPDFRTVTRSMTLAAPTASTAALWKAASELLTQRLPASGPFRLLGVGISAFAETQSDQGQLFDSDATNTSEPLDEVADAIRERFGASALNSASAFHRGGKNTTKISAWRQKGAKGAKES